MVAYRSFTIILALITIAVLVVLLIFILTRASGAAKTFAASGAACLIVEMIIGYSGVFVSNRIGDALTASAIVSVFARFFSLAGITLLVYGAVKASQDRLQAPRPPYAAQPGQPYQRPGYPQAQPYQGVGDYAQPTNPYPPQG